MGNATTAYPQAPIPRLLGFSGTRRNLRAHERFIVNDVLDNLHAWAGFVTGACCGIDHYVGEHLARRFPMHQHVVLVPADRSRVARWWEPFGEIVQVREMPPETTYADRNRAIVSASVHLMAFPEGAERDHPRSGTWQTIRMAKRVHDAHPLVLPLSEMR